MSSQFPQPTEMPEGIRVGDYELLSRIGSGGMGVVHLARPLTGGEPVALKVLRPHIVGDDEARERLAREVRSLSLVRSRWIAEVIDADPYGPVPYIATRYVQGDSLHDHVAQHGAIADLPFFAKRLADAIAAVHGVGVLHRDIKPSNVLIESGSPILIDFGLARLADDPRLTNPGWLIGTPGYLAPEILHGAEGTPASDLHSWAATVAFAGLARAPFGRGPSMAIMDRVRRGEHDLSGLDPIMLPLVTASLHPDPQQRPTLPQIREWLTRITSQGNPQSGAGQGSATPGNATPGNATQGIATLATQSVPLDEAPTHVGAQPMPAPIDSGAWAQKLWEPPTLVEPVEPLTQPDQTPRRRPFQEPPRPDPAARRTPPGPRSTPLPPAAEPGPVQPGQPVQRGQLAQPGHPVQGGSVQRGQLAQPGHPVQGGPVQQYPGKQWEPAPGARAERPAVRATLAALLLLGLSAVIAFLPVAGSLALICAAWLLRGGSVAASARQERLQRRGRKWYEPLLLAVSSPVHLLTALPGLIMLVIWSACIGLACWLIGFGVSLPGNWAIGLGALGFVVSMWWGPGSGRVRSPARTGLAPLARQGLLAVLLGVLVVTILVGGLWLVAQQGPHWWPLNQPSGIESGIRDWIDGLRG